MKYYGIYRNLQAFDLAALLDYCQTWRSIPPENFPNLFQGFLAIAPSAANQSRRPNRPR